MVMVVVVCVCKATVKDGDLGYREHVCSSKVGTHCSGPANQLPTGDIDSMQLRSPIFQKKSENILK